MIILAEKEKFCKHHGLTKYILNSQKKWVCIKCRVKHTVEARKRKKQKAVDLLGGKCSNCGYDKCLDALDFHHLDPTKKDPKSFEKNVAWSILKEEIKKCILLCSNCHRELHAGIREDKRLQLLN